MSFAENLNRICRKEGTTLTAVIKEVKGSTSFATAINKKGSIPKEEDLTAMARILHCSVADFFKDDLPLADTQPIDPDEYDLLAIYRGLSRRDKHAFMTMIYDFAENREPEEAAPYEDREL